MALKTGARLRAQNSACEVVVVRGGAEVEALSCAGLEMLPDAAPTTAGEPEGPRVELGKRYVDDEDGVEVLCVKAGIGPLAVSGRELVLKTAKPLPSSD
jgi:hypothetical protein